jgi:hypothetical protein
VGNRTVAATILVVAATATGAILAVGRLSGRAPVAPQPKLVANQQVPSAEPNPRTSPASTFAPATPCVPRVTLPYPDSRIRVAGQGGPFGSSENFWAGSSWAGAATSRGPTYAVWAGESGVGATPPSTSAVNVYTEQVSANGCGVDYRHVGVFTDSSLTGLLTIASSYGHWLRLTVAHSQTVYFDLLTDVFTSRAIMAG